MAIECLDNIIGITDKNCACFDGSKPGNFAALNESTSGRYMTDQDFGVPIQAAVYNALDCGDGTIWEEMINFRKRAARQFVTDLRIKVMKYNEAKMTSFSGYVGRKNGVRQRTVSHIYSGLQLRPHRIKDAFFRLKGIALGWTEDETVKITINSNDLDFTPLSYEISALENTYQTLILPTPVELPFYSKHCGRLYYTFSYSGNKGNPLDDDFRCCGFIPEYLQHMDVGGFDTSVLNQESEYCSATPYGISLDGNFGCNNMDWLCKMEELGDYEFDDVVAICIECLASVFTIDHILSTGKISHYTTLLKDPLIWRQRKLNKKYSGTLEWMASKIPNHYTGCFGPKINADIS